MDVVGVAMPPAAEFVLEFNYAHLPSITPLSPPFTPLSPPFPHHHLPYTTKRWTWSLGSLYFFEKYESTNHHLGLVLQVHYVKSVVRNIDADFKYFVMLSHTYYIRKTNPLVIQKCQINNDIVLNVLYIQLHPII